MSLRESAETHLVDEVLAVIVRELLGADDAVHVGLHQLLRERTVKEVKDKNEHWSASSSEGRRRTGRKAGRAQERKTDGSHLDQVHFREELVADRPDNVEQRDDVFVSEMTEELDLSERAQAEHRVVEGSNSLDGHFGSRRQVDGRNAVERRRKEESDHGRGS